MAKHSEALGNMNMRFGLKKIQLNIFMKAENSNCQMAEHIHQISIYQAKMSL